MKLHTSRRLISYLAPMVLVTIIGNRGNYGGKVSICFYLASIHKRISSFLGNFNALLLQKTSKKYKIVCNVT